MIYRTINMHTSSSSAKNNNPTSKFRLPRPLAGALIGIIVYTLILIWAWKTDDLFILFAVQPLAIWASLFFEAIYLLPIPNSLANFLSNTIAYLISSIFPAILGSLLVSGKKQIRIAGIVLFLIYFVFSFCTGFAMVFITMR